MPPPKKEKIKHYHNFNGLDRQARSFLNIHKFFGIQHASFLFQEVILQKKFI